MSGWEIVGMVAVLIVAAVAALLIVGFIGERTERRKKERELTKQNAERSSTYRRNQLQMHRLRETEWAYHEAIAGLKDPERWTVTREIDDQGHLIVTAVYGEQPHGDAEQPTPEERARQAKVNAEVHDLSERFRSVSKSVETGEATLEYLDAFAEQIIWYDFSPRYDNVPSVTAQSSSIAAKVLHIDPEVGGVAITLENLTDRPLKDIRVQLAIVPADQES